MKPNKSSMKVDTHTHSDPHKNHLGNQMPPVPLFATNFVTASPLKSQEYQARRPSKMRPTRVAVMWMGPGSL